jgi:hypothetical protein
MPSPCKQAAHSHTETSGTVTRNQAARQAIHLLAATVLSSIACATASAAQSVTLQATLTPEQLGHGTTIGFSFKIVSPTHEVPPPLTSTEISYPVELAFALSELGLATCSTPTLEVFGVEGCPPNSLMGYGTALAEVPIGPSIASESAQVTIMRTTNQAGRLALLIYVNALSPVSSQITFPGLVLPATAPYGGLLDMSIPLVTSLPEGPDVAVVQFRSTLGPLHLHYHEHIGGRVIEYQPKGVPLPDKCPHGGFRFSARFAFKDGSHSKATTTVPCPPQRH